MFYTDKDDDFVDLVEAVKGLTADWDKLALYLHLNEGDIKIIKKDNPQDAEACLIKTIYLWLKENHNTAKFGHPSWKTLVRGVGKMDNRLANEIADRHRGNTLAIYGHNSFTT